MLYWKKKKKYFNNYWDKGSSNGNAGSKGVKENIFPVSREGKTKMNEHDSSYS